MVKGIIAADFTLMVDFTPSDNDGVGVVFRFQDPGTFYRVMSMADTANGGPITRLERWDNYVFSTLQYTTDVAYDTAGPNTFAIVATGPVLSVYLNDMTTPLLEATDFTYLEGRVGLAVYAEEGVSFTRIELTP